MKVIIAGYNIDKSLIDQLKADTATPEVLCAAYARISRSKKSVDQLRSEALNEVDKARKSNTSIIFDMGHASISEHAVFNLDLIGVSRYLAEYIQRSRLASFTEKSQRYVTFTNDFITPTELSRHPQLKKSYKSYMQKLFSEYQASYEKILKRYQKSEPKAKKRQLECRAKEDARYILPLATKTQMGVTINARNIEALLRRLAHLPFAEAHELKMFLFSQINQISPSLIRYTEPDGFTGQVNPEAVGFSGFMQQELPWVADLDLCTKVKLLSSPKAADDRILSSIIYSSAELDYFTTLETVQGLPKIVKDQLWQQFFTGLKSWHKMPRAFESVDFEFEISMSESCWAQFKRHRPCTLIKKSANPAHLVIPPVIKDLRRSRIWETLMREGVVLADSLPEKLAHISPYLKLNATPVKVYAKMNLREIYHFVRLRSDIHAQWEIREISDAMVKIVKKYAPKAAARLCGKSDFELKA